MAVPKGLKKIRRGEYLYRGFRLIGCAAVGHYDTLKGQIVPYNVVFEGFGPEDVGDNEFNLKRAMKRIDRFYETGE